MIMALSFIFLKLGIKSGCTKRLYFGAKLFGSVKAFLALLSSLGLHAVKDRLATGHRSRRWGQPQHCLFCDEPDETRDHLFFACPYTFTLWLKMVENLFGTDPDPDWDITLSTMLSRSYDRLTFILLRLVLQVTIYFIWRERNKRKHGTSHKTVGQLAKLIDKTVRNCISSTKYTLSPRLQGLMIRWFAAHDTAN